MPATPAFVNWRLSPRELAEVLALVEPKAIAADAEFAGLAEAIQGIDWTGFGGRYFPLHEIGRGLVAYDAEDAEKIKGRSSPDVMAILGVSGRAEMIHRDDLVML